MLIRFCVNRPDGRKRFVEVFYLAHYGNRRTDSFSSEFTEVHCRATELQTLQEYRYGEGLHI